MRIKDDDGIACGHSRQPSDSGTTDKPMPSPWKDAHPYLFVYNIGGIMKYNDSIYDKEPLITWLYKLKDSRREKDDFWSLYDLACYEQIIDCIIEHRREYMPVLLENKLYERAYRDILKKWDALEKKK